MNQPRLRYQHASVGSAPAATDHNPDVEVAPQERPPCWRRVLRWSDEHAGRFASMVGLAGATIVVAATISPETMLALKPRIEARGQHLVDAPVVYGASGARDGTLLSLCGGAEADVERVRPLLACYSRDVVHVGPLGAGQIAKSCNNLLHWIHCVANFETLLIAKRYGLDAQRMREILLQCPASNVTLARWDTTRFTWQEKDMDVTLELAQKAGLILPLTGQVDQLVKALKAADVKALLYGEEATYLGRSVRPMSKEEGGLV